MQVLNYTDVVHSLIAIHKIQHTTVFTPYYSDHISYTSLILGYYSDCELLKPWQANTCLAARGAALPSPSRTAGFSSGVNSLKVSQSVTY